MEQKLKQHQPPMSVEEQIENLKNIGLKIDDEAKAVAFLNDVSYFRLIKAYGLGLKPKNSNFYNAVTFDEIMELYLFNSNFRQLLFTQIEKVEINLRCRIANYFSVQYGVLGYEDSNNFADPEHHEEFLEDIYAEVGRNSKSPFVRNFQQNYEGGKLPLYALIELFSFGTLSKFYKNMKNPDKKAIAKQYGIGYTYLESWIEHIAFVRNICAHYGRLYNTNLHKSPILYKEYDKMGISNHRVFATVVCLKHLLPHDRHWSDFVDTIEMFFDKYDHVKTGLMGFPPNWKEIILNEKT